MINGEKRKSKQYWVKKNDEAALLSDSSNSNGKDLDNNQCTLTTTNQLRTAFAYFVIEKNRTKWKELLFSIARRVEGRKVFTGSPGGPQFEANGIITLYDVRKQQIYEITLKTFCGQICLTFLQLILDTQQKFH